MIDSCGSVLWLDLKTVLLNMKNYIKSVAKMTIHVVCERRNSRFTSTEMVIYSLKTKQYNVN